MIKNLLEVSHMAGFYKGRQGEEHIDTVDSQRFLEQSRENYRRHLEKMLSAFQFAFEAAWESPLAQDEIQRAIGWLQTEIGELK